MVPSLKADVNVHLTHNSEHQKPGSGIYNVLNHGNGEVLED